MRRRHRADWKRSTRRWQLRAGTLRDLIEQTVPSRVEVCEMNAIKSALLLGLALCVAASSGLARETGSHAKSTRAEKSSRSSSGKSRKTSSKSRKAKAHKTEAHASRGSEADRFLRDAPDLPAEDLPEAESDDDGDSQLR
jgi:hypothetical protein